MPAMTMIHLEVGWIEASSVVHANGCILVNLRVDDGISVVRLRIHLHSLESTFESSERD